MVPLTAWNAPVRASKRADHLGKAKQTIVAVNGRWSERALVFRVDQHWPSLERGDRWKTVGRLPETMARDEGNVMGLLTRPLLATRIAEQTQTDGQDQRANGGPQSQVGTSGGEEPIGGGRGGG